ncbi:MULTISPECIES: mersacidin family lantibiotic [Exiguobacterium]|nr:MULTISPECIES: mersacidin family lantibiotic [Exiguobacterium]SDD41851.1 type 2 lantibiotic, SP_1948 family [Exiguobacterium enclense]
MTEKEIMLMNATCGEGMKSLDTEKMSEIYGASDVDPRWTPVISLVARSIVKSTKACIGAGASAISGIVSHNKDCLG